MMSRAAFSKSSAELALITKVARLYHQQGISQPQIAERLSLSQPRVSRLLKEAIELGIVRITVVSPGSVHSDLEQALCQKFGLQDAVVAHIDEPNDESILQAIGAAGANYLEVSLNAQDVMGISSWSATLLAVVEAMQSSTAKASKVIQLQGGVGNPAAQIQATRLTDRLATLTSADALFLAAPGVVASVEVRDGLLQDQYIAQVVGSWDSLDVALLGIGALQPSPLLADSGNSLNPDDLAGLSEQGAVGDVCLHFFDTNGVHVPSSFEDRTIGISAGKLRAIPRKIGFAGGPRKLEAIRAAAIGGWVDVLVTDSATAAALLAD